MGKFRLERVERLLREQIAQMILRGEVKDHRVTPMVLIHEVEVSKDLNYAKVLVSGYLEKERLDEAVEGLEHAAGFIQAQLGKRLKFRATPKLRFVADHSLKEGFELTQHMRREIPPQSDAESNDDADGSGGEVST
mgnify:CR=1 FL=1